MTQTFGASPELLEKVRALGEKLEEPGAMFQLMTAQEMKNLPPLEWLIEGYIPKKGLAVLYGPSGGGKSFSALDFALSVATGREWFGHKVTKGPVIYVAGEGVTGYPKRLDAWEKDHRLYVLHNFYFNPGPVNLIVRNEILAFIELAQELPENPGLVIFDTLATCMQGGDENSVRDMGMVTGHCRLIQRMTGAATLLVHHTTKASNTERGSGALRGQADAMINLMPEDDTFLLLVDKQKDGAAADPISLRLVPVMNTESCVIGLAEHTEKRSGLTKDQRKVLRALSLFPEGASRKDWQEACDMKLGPFMVVVNALVDQNYVNPPEEKPKRYRIADSGLRALGV